MNRFCSVIIGVLSVAGTASAQELIFSQRYTEACLWALAPDQSAEPCIGESAAQCMADTPGGYSTVGMAGCLDREWQFWDEKLNAAYKARRAEARAADAERDDPGSMVPSQADALRDMQRAWIAWRDATCDYERALWGGGTGGGPASVSCHMTLTARQALYLEAGALQH